jgi:hypothetical protein
MNVRAVIGATEMVTLLTARVSVTACVALGLVLCDALGSTIHEHSRVRIAWALRAGWTEMGYKRPCRASNRKVPGMFACSLDSALLRDLSASLVNRRG